MGRQRTDVIGARRRSFAPEKRHSFPPEIHVSSGATRRDSFYPVFVIGTGTRRRADSRRESCGLLLSRIITEMPFFAKDWRSPGEVWIKTDDGWEKQKILECRMNVRSPNSDRPIDSNKENCSVDNHRALRQLQGYVPPYCQITLRCTKEVRSPDYLLCSRKR